jgi:uncharacterized protein YijF (DUF1287 family)
LRYLATLEISALETGATLKFRDQTSCATIGVLSLDFAQDADPLVVVADGAPPIARPMTVAEHESLGPPFAAYQATWV